MNPMRIHKRAFTLPELLLVAAILCYSLSFVLLTFFNGTALNEASRNLISATAHAEYILENLKNTAFSRIADDINNKKLWTWDKNAIGANGLIALNSESISTTATGVNPLDITVQINWLDSRGRSRSKILRTLISG